jgi:ACS family tartrate transporter-like MFS transporter
VGNLGGFVGPNVVGYVKQVTGSYEGGIWFLAGMMTVAVVIVLSMGMGKKEPAQQVALQSGTTG